MSSSEWESSAVEGMGVCAAAADLLEGLEGEEEEVDWRERLEEKECRKRFFWR